MNVQQNFIIKRHSFQKIYLSTSNHQSLRILQNQNDFDWYFQQQLNLKFKILRPLLKISRFECLKFCEFWNLPIFPDLTNFDSSNRRNRLRLQALPYLQYFFNLNIFRKIDQIQTILDLENEYFRSIFLKISTLNLSKFSSKKQYKKTSNFYLYCYKI